VGSDFVGEDDQIKALLGTAYQVGQTDARSSTPVKSARARKYWRGGFIPRAIAAGVRSYR
jgi:hypothetical protein